MTSILQAGAFAAVALGTGAATVSVMKDDMPDLSVPEFPWEQGSLLDGRIFHTRDRIEQTGDLLKDELHFSDGRFLSAMCQEYCDFGWSDYRQWRDGETIHFTATTVCPDAPHTVVFYGTVSGDDVHFEGTWTTRRWYWTRQLNVTGEGSGAPRDGAADTG